MEKGGRFVGTELYLFFLMTEALNIIMTRAIRHLDAEGMSLKQERKLWMNRLRNQADGLLKLVSKCNDEIIENQPKMAERYDHQRRLANALARLCVVAYDRTKGMPTALDALVDELQKSLEEQGVIPKEEIDWFRMK